MGQKIAVADGWGQVGILHVTVVPASTTTTGSSETCTPAATLTQTSGSSTTTQVITLCHSVSIYTTLGEGGVQLSSIVMVQPYTPAGPTLALTLRNMMGCCITNLTAVLVLNSNFAFRFTGVSLGYPLDNEQYASSVETLIGGGFDSAKNYTFVIKGTTQDTAFTDTVQTRIPPGYSYLDYLTASGSCTSNGQPAPCWGSDDPFVFQCVNLLAGPANQWTCTEKVTGNIEPSQSYNITV